MIYNNHLLFIFLLSLYFMPKPFQTRTKHPKREFPKDVLHNPETKIEKRAANKDSFSARMFSKIKEWRAKNRRDRILSDKKLSPSLLQPKHKPLPPKEQLIFQQAGDLILRMNPKTEANKIAFLNRVRLQFLIGNISSDYLQKVVSAFSQQKKVQRK